MIVPKMAVTINIVSIERTFTRFNAVVKPISALVLKRNISAFSCVYDCTVGIAFNISPAMALLSAMRSCDSRDNFFTFRPIKIIGKISNSIKPMLIENK